MCMHILTVKLFPKTTMYYNQLAQPNQVRYKRILYIAVAIRYYHLSFILYMNSLMTTLMACVSNEHTL